jgi:membrane protease YdiL (CAAX protease family)
VIERLYALVPILALCATVLLVGHLYLRCINEWLLKKKEVDERFIEKNKLRCLFLVLFPHWCIIAPAYEECLFRAPLIALCPFMAPFAWVGITLQALLFALFHRKTVLPDQSLLVRRAGVFILGMFAGYAGVLYQSLAASILVHFVWNFIIVLVIAANAIFKKEPTLPHKGA